MQVFEQQRKTWKPSGMTSLNAVSQSNLAFGKCDQGHPARGSANMPLNATECHESESFLVLRPGTACTFLDTPSPGSLAKHGCDAQVVVSAAAKRAWPDAAAQSPIMQSRQTRAQRLRRQGKCPIRPGILYREVGPTQSSFPGAFCASRLLATEAGANRREPKTKGQEEPAIAGVRARGSAPRAERFDVTNVCGALEQGAMPSCDAGLSGRCAAGQRSHDGTRGKSGPDGRRH